MNWIKLLKKVLLIILAYVFIFELLFQLFFFFDLKFIKNPDLFYNGYCDQKYWNLRSSELKFDDNVQTHPILSYKKREIFIPNKFKQDSKIENSKFSKNKVFLYGSSYINHKDLKNITGKFEDIDFINYGLASYGLDQIYLSYKLTAHLNQNKIIVFGFLLEDLDRSLFSKREYQKAQFVFENNKFRLKNIPIDQKVKVKKVNDFYLFRFLKNFYQLSINDFDSRLSRCKIDKKKRLFEYYFNQIQKDAKKFNQEIIVITFNLKEDFIKNTSWRYNFITSYLEKNNINHIDSLKILKKESVQNDEKLENYFGSDAHNNEKSFNYIINEFIKIYNAI